jgi:hypothetical protein
MRNIILIILSAVVATFATVTPTNLLFSGSTYAQQVAQKTPEKLIREIYITVQNSKSRDDFLYQKPMLDKYFDKELTRLFLRDRDCSQRGRRIYNLDFDPFTMSQAGFPEKGFFNFSFRRLKSNPDAVIEVTFSWFAGVTGKKRSQKVIYHAKLTESGWRISDIVHPSPNGEFSIKSQLSQPNRLYSCP